MDLNAGKSTAPVEILGDDPQTDFPRSQFSPGGVGVLSSTSVTLMSDNSRRRGSAGNSYSPGENSMTDLGFPRTIYTPGKLCAAELDFPQASFPPGESCAAELDYIRLASLTGSPVCAWTVTGSLLFGSPHRRVRGCSRLTLLCLQRFDGLDVIRCTNVRQHDIHGHLLVTINSRFTPDFIKSVLIDTGSGSSFCGACVIARWEKYLLGHDRLEFCRCRQCLVLPGNLAWIVLTMIYLSYSLEAGSFLSSGRSSAMDQAGPSSASSAPLPGTFLGLVLDMRSDRIYDLVPDIPDVMGLRALRHCLCSCPDISMVWSGCGGSAGNALDARSREIVLIVESIFSRIWASTLPGIT